MNSININKDEVLRYLGYKNQALEENTLALINEGIEETKSLIDPRYSYRFFTILREEKGIFLKEYPLYLPGNNISYHLRNSKSCVLFSATLGINVDRRISYYEKIDMAKALILNACATTAIEEFCDSICEEIGQEVKIDNKKLTARYSPGYGDFPLGLQKELLEATMQYKNIGITASEYNILYPRKSVTAILGIIDEALPLEKKSCANCSGVSNCNFKREGDVCGA